MLVLWSAWNAHWSRRHRRCRFINESLLSRHKELHMYGICMYNNFTYRLIWEYKYILYELLKWCENIKQGRAWLQSPTLRFPQVYSLSKLPVFFQVESYRYFHYLAVCVRTECRNFAPLLHLEFMIWNTVSFQPFMCVYPFEDWNECLFF